MAFKRSGERNPVAGRASGQDEEWKGHPAGQQQGGSQGEEVGAMPPGRASLEVARIVRHPRPSGVLRTDRLV